METNEYLQLFIEESEENLQALNENLLALERQPEDLEIVNTIFRSAHTLKGMSGAMNFDRMAHLTHEMESRLDELRCGQLGVTDDVMNVLFESLDVLQRQLDRITTLGSDDGIDITNTVAHLRGLGASKDERQSEVAATKPTLDVETEAAIQKALLADSHVFSVDVMIDPDSPMPSVRGFMVKRAYEEIGDVLWSYPLDVTSEEFRGVLTLVVGTMLDADLVKQTALDVLEVKEVLVQPVEMNHTGGTTTASVDSVKQVSTSLRHIQAKSVRVDVDKLDMLMNLYSEFVIDKTRLEQLSRTIDHHELKETVQHLSRVGADLQDIIMKIRMIPLETVFNRFPRMIRDLSKALNKKVNFDIFGAETEIDRVLADEIADPLVHMLRNSMDHGLETPEERKASQKPEVGSVRLSAYHAGNHVFIEIQDNGRGIQREKVLSKAVQQGLIQAADADSLSDEAVFSLLFQSGFSTAEQVSDISGRGVGLDAVQSKIQSLSGEVTVRSVPGEGSTFVIRLPLTVSILSSMLVSVGEETFAIPTSSIIYMDKLGAANINTVQGQTVWDYRGKWIPLAFLRDLLTVPKVNRTKDMHVAVLSKGDKLLALGVDSFIGQQEVVLKSLGSLLHGSTRGISGATILGDGQVALILDPNPFIH